MNGYFEILNRDTKTIGELIRALSPHYDLYIPKCDKLHVGIQYCTTEVPKDDSECEG